jgi:hypothetical protein
VPSLPFIDSSNPPAIPVACNAVRLPRAGRDPARAASRIRLACRICGGESTSQDARLQALIDRASGETGVDVASAVLSLRSLCAHCDGRGPRRPAAPGSTHAHQYPAGK